MIDARFFNNARGEASSLQMAPPFAFSDVKMTVFPLQANLSRLTQFCDGYLNQAEQIVQFKPFLPFVYLIILDYGRMSAAATQTGWVSQREVAFGVPLRWMAPDDSGELAFKDFAFTTPFIFVDNELSLSTGREVYGWPKLLARLDPRIDEWIKDPHGARRVFEIRSRAAADRAGDDLKAPFLSVTQTPLTGLMDFPMNPSSAIQAMSATPSAWVAIARMLRDAGVALGGIAMERAREADSLSELLKLDGVRKFLSADNMQGLLSPKNWANMGDTLRAMFPKIYSNTINLKQFRDAENPMTACYQAITAAKMPIVRFGGGGFLGTQNMLMGQLDGGYRVNIINTSTVPVVSHLGLVEAGQREVDGGVLSSFAPVCPFWVEIDMIYDLGETLAMRSRSGGWIKPSDAAVEEAPIPVPRPRRRRPVADPERRPDETTGDAGGSGEAPELGATLAEERLARDVHLIEASNPFNTTRGASEALGGLFRFKGSKIRILPLLADPKVLNKFVQAYIEVPKHMRAEAWGNHVYMISSHHEEITSELSPGKTGHSREITFAVPIKCYDWDADGSSKGRKERRRDPLRRYEHGASHLIGTALVTPFNYVDDITSAITESEVFGVPTLRSEIVSPPEGWAAEESQEGILLEGRAIVVPSLGTGSEGTRRTLIEVRDNPMFPPGNTDGWRHISTEWGERLAEDLMRKVNERDESGSVGELRGTARGASGKDDVEFSVDQTETPVEAKRSFQWGRAMALRILGGLHGVNTLSLKQFRDATEPDLACYQGVVMRGTKIEKLHWMEEIDRDLTVSITRYPTQPIAETLGLIPKRTVVKDGGVCDEFEPIRPMEMHADLITTRGKTLFERTKGTDWKLINLPDGPLGWRPASEGDVDRARETPDLSPVDPKISYVRYDPNTDTHGRLTPLLLTDREHKAFKQGMREQYVRDPQLLWRGVELGTLVDESVLRMMDERMVDDIHNFVRTRDRNLEERRASSASDVGEGRVTELAGYLEFVSPATVLDSILSRGWGARVKGKPGAQTYAEDFRIRRNTLGPELADELFPERECQDGYWPRHEEHWLAANLRDSMAEASLPHQFRKFLDAINLDDQHDMNQIRAIAAETLPGWFYESAFERKPVVDQLLDASFFGMQIGEEEHEGGEALSFRQTLDTLKSAMSLLGVWPAKFKQELHDGISDFFAALNTSIDRGDGIPEDIHYFGREWTRLTARLVDESVPDDVEDPETIDFEDLINVVDEKQDAPSAGWLYARLGDLSENHTAGIAELKDRAEDWQQKLRKRLDQE